MRDFKATELHIWCSTVVRSNRHCIDWRLDAENLRHCIVTTFEDCPEEDVRCPWTGCDGVCRARPEPASPKEKTRKRRSRKKA